MYFSSLREIWPYFLCLSQILGFFAKQFSWDWKHSCTLEKSDDINSFIPLQEEFRFNERFSSDKVNSPTLLC